MDVEEFYERWRRSRSQIEPSDGLADRVMESISAQSAPLEPQPRGQWTTGIVRASVCAAAALAALFRVVELLNLFSASRLDN